MVPEVPTRPLLASAVQPGGKIEQGCDVLLHGVLCTPRQKSLCCTSCAVRLNRQTASASTAAHLCSCWLLLMRMVLMACAGAGVWKSSTLRLGSHAQVRLASRAWHASYYTIN
jgi:hypothetical protein